MKTSTKDQLEGLAHEVKGAVKEEAGKIMGDAKLQAEGQGEKIAGTVQKKIGEIKNVVGK